ncbi:hypothetical protein K450DRAFT_248867 [Umbelopsis ramanniana AG]|uniref:Uncharacterized protein n=1 Tax=Umbelopsis ramanniana AG TaxID=1314678 RepID=A0AAD5E5Y2_UMBRA|nr:uncharacterized protein K450DRAFT_248867 [Umbelopsis ramanniana AG]KAI8578068.1 hypothetical protein K450DRAFT_248867 [Umbelopsis ramanniana AG]
MNSQAQPGRLRRLLGSGSKNKSHRLSLNTSNTYLNESINKSPDEANRRQSMQILTSPTSVIDNELGFASKPYESTAAGESPSLSLQGVSPSPQRNLPARPQSSMSFRKHSSPSFHQFHSSGSAHSLELIQSPTSIEPMNAIPENDTIPFVSNQSRKKDGDRQYASLNLSSPHRIDSSKRSLSSNNLRSDTSVSSMQGSFTSEKSSTLSGARKRISALLPESWQSDTVRSRRLTMSSLSHSSDNETSASESPPMTPANPGAQFIHNDEDDFQLPHHKPISPITPEWNGLLKNEPGEYFSEKPTSHYPLLPDQNGNGPAADEPVPQTPCAMPFLARAQSTRSLKSQDEQWTYSKPARRYLAEQVRMVLGSALTEADSEIEQEWEVHRETERQNSMSSTYSRAVGGLA